MRYLMAVIAAMGLLVAASNGIAQTYTYDDLGRVKSVTPASGSASTYNYDNADNRTCTALGTGVCATNHAPTCNNWVINMNSVPVNAAPVSGSVVAGSFLANCADADADTLTVSSPAMPMPFTIAAHQTLNYAFSVSDGKGGTASAVLTMTRP